MKYIAHRGLSARYPENSLQAFRAAVESGAQYVECDVWLSSDNELMVIHDATLDRTIGKKGRVSELTALALIESGVPTLAHVLAVIDTATLIVELKGKGTAEVLADALLRLPDEGGIAHERIIVSSFMKTELVRMKRLFPDVSLAVLVCGAPTEDEIDLYRSWGAHALHINDDGDDIDESLVRQVHDRGMELWAYAVDGMDRAHLLDMLGVDGVFIDDIRQSAS